MPKIKIKFSFLLFNALIFIFRESSLILGFYGACIIHETGHILAVYLTGGSVSSVEFSWLGIKMTAAPTSSFKSAAFVQLCGPIANILAFLILVAGGKGGYFAVFSLMEGLLNLLPYKFLDGGTILEILADLSENQREFRVFTGLIRVAFSTILAVLFIFHSDKLNDAILTLLIN